MTAVDPAHLVGAGGVVGALLRYEVHRRVSGTDFPLGTVTVNVVGSFVLAFVTLAGASTDVVLLVGTGACGSFTTFSSFSVETVRLWEQGARLRAGVNAAGTLVGALGAVALAWMLVSAV